MKRLLTVVLMFVIVSALLVGISFGAGEERFIFSDLTVIDKSTGLVWTKNANIAGKKMNWYKANDYIKQLNEQKYAGHSDWRLPTIKELQSVRDYTKKVDSKKCRAISTGHRLPMPAILNSHMPSIW